MDTKRLILFVIFSFSIMMLWDSWQRKDAPVVSVAERANSASPAADGGVSAKPSDIATGGFKLESAPTISVNTDLYQAKISKLGGDLRQLVLNEHRASEIKHGNFTLMDDAANPMLYVAQTGLIGGELPTHKSQFTSASDHYTMDKNAQKQEVKLTWTANGVTVNKVYTFHRDSYVIDVDYEIINASDAAISPSAYYQLIHDGLSNQGSAMMPTFTGGAYFTNDTHYKKIKFKEMVKNNLSLEAKDGWIAVVQHYFAGAWIPKSGTPHQFYTKALGDDIFAVGYIDAVGAIAPGATAKLNAKLYAGPQTAKDLNAAAPGLEYVVDYGWLTVIAKPLFWLLSQIHHLVGNWGIAIILLTVLIKAAFFKLSASSYRSMAHMREMAPRLQSLKEKFGDDKQQMQQAMMEMYRTEKINPLGGCLPIVVQIPVFIALYWVLLGSIELRHAPFFGWIQDLSATDPYYILPLLMGSTMIIQSFLNPPPTDPIQAKVMKIMPVVFSVFFFFFPAGLVLYWLVNNILSITQQWYINKTIHAEALAKKGSAKR